MRKKFQNGRELEVKGLILCANKALSRTEEKLHTAPMDILK